MAYRHFDSDPTMGWTSASPARSALRHPPRPWTLSREERQIVLLSRRDATATLRTPGPVARAVRLLFGLQSANRLANPRLEALRRFAVLRRVLGDALPETEFGQLVDAGYDNAAANDVDRLLLDRVSRPAREVSRTILLTLLVSLATVGMIQLGRVLGHRLDDVLLGFVLAGLIGTSAVPVTALFLPGRRTLG
jgi:hypothetical protein